MGAPTTLHSCVRKGPRIDRSRKGSLLALALLLAALVAGGTLAGAQSPAVDDRPHLLVVPHSPDGDAALDRSDARVVARYEDFTLVEAAGSDDARLRRVGADRRDDMREVSLPSAEFDPRSQRASLAAKNAPDRHETLAVVQFVGPVKDAWLGRLEDTGARVVQYASQNAYVVHADGGEVDRLAGLVGTDNAVRAVTPVAPADKVDDALTSSGPRTMAVQTIAGDPGAAARREAESSGPSVRAGSSVGELRTQFVRIDGPEAAGLAEDPGVVSITPWSPPRLLDERAAQIVAGNVLPGGAPSDDPTYLDWLTSEGFEAANFLHAIDFTDQGLDNGSATAPDHPDFYVNGSPAQPDRVSYAFDYTSDTPPGAARDCGGHGTNVASIAAGFGTAVAGDGFRYGMGVAPLTAIGASKVFDCGGEFDYQGDFASLVSNAYDAGARISNNSWGESDFGAYGVDAQEFDALVRDVQPGVGQNEEMVEIFAAGNDGLHGYGSVGSPGTAKNVITVGASESVRAINGVDGCGVSDAEADDPDDIIDFSSRGPTDDGRLKPDLVAPGTHVVGARPRHPGYTGAAACDPFFDGFYSLLSGSSQAAPEVAGAASLIRDWYRRGQGGDLPSPAMTKAILANTAADVVGGQNGKGTLTENAPNTDQGWGRVNLRELLEPPSPVVHDQSAVLSSSGDSALSAYQVQNPGRPVKVTLAWTDAPGAVAAKPYVNDLDLVVEAGGHTYKGNVFANGRSISGGTADPRNNLESVFLPAGTSGRFAVRVVGTSIPGDGVPGDTDETDQDFALVVSNGAEQSSPVLVDGATSIGDADGDHALEPGEPFQLHEVLRNAGDVRASDVSGNLSGGDLTLTQASSTWSDLAPGESAATNAPFAGRLSPGASCGADVTATLDVSAGQETQSVPLTLPTGTPQPPTVVSRGHSPAVFIPDNNTAGITSTIQVANPGRIKDLNVRINGIAHPHVGDLRIDLIGPDGTTVRLAEHPGGPGNGGDNLTNTVFDDEAGASISAGAAPYTGRFRPQNDQLSRFDGKQRQGTWTLRVRDLLAGDAGTLSGWGTETQAAACDFGGAAPETRIDAGPPNPSNTRDATFQVSSNAAGARFECKLDSADFGECAPAQSYSGLADGSHTFSVRAVDGAGNIDVTPASYSWQVSVPPPTAGGGGGGGPPGTSTVDTTAPNFALTPTEGHLGDALTRGLTVLAGCATACKVSATLTISARTARSHGLRSRKQPASGSYTLASTMARLRAGSPRAVTLRLPSAAKAALRGKSSLRATLGFKIPGSGRTLRLRQPITLSQDAGLRGVVRRGLRLAAICSERCTLRGRLVLTRREARRIGLRAPGGGPVTVASGNAAASTSRSRLTLRVGGAYRRALLRARRSVKPTFGALVRGATGPGESATRRLVLRP